MLNERFVILGIFINLLGSAGYIRAIFNGTAQPNRVSWFLWSLAPMIGFAAELSQGVGIQSLTTFAAGFCPFIVFLASFASKKAYWKIGLFDIACGVLSLVALAGWFLTGTGVVALAFAVLADVLAATPTVIKSYSHPETENASEFYTGGINAVIGLLVLSAWDFIHVAFPLYILCMCLALIVLIRFPKLRFRPADLAV